VRVRNKNYVYANQVEILPHADGLIPLRLKLEDGRVVMADMPPEVAATLTTRIAQELSKLVAEVELSEGAERVRRD